MAKRKPTVVNRSIGEGEVNARQDAVALSLASGMTVAEAARRNRVGTTTVHVWRDQPAFVRRVNELRSEMLSQALGRLTSHMTHAADTLSELARKAKQESVKLAAARSVIELGVKLRDSLEFENRLAALEALQKGKVYG